MGGKFTIFAWFYFVFEGKFQVLATGGAYIWRDDVTGFFASQFLGGLYLGGGGAYFRNFTVYQIRHSVSSDIHTIKKWIEKNNEAQLSLMSLTLICLEIGCNTGSAVFIEPPK